MGIHQPIEMAKKFVDPEKQHRSISVTLPPDLIQELNAEVSRTQGMTRSGFVQKLLADKLRRKKRK